MFCQANGQGETTGHKSGGEDDNWPRSFLSLPVQHQPGTWFVYNTAATYMLSAIITRLTAQPLLEYLRPRLLDLLGIENPTWEIDPRGVNIGGSGLNLKTEEIARFGQMYLQKGTWDGKRILTEQWIAEATKQGVTARSIVKEEGVTSQVYGELSSTAEVKAGQKYLNDIVASLRADSIEVETEVCHSLNPNREIVRYAQRIEPDLLIMGAHGHGRLKDLVFGDTINPVRHKLNVPILVVRDPRK